MVRMSPSALSAGPPSVSLAAHLRQWDDDRLTHLLRLRPDLATPAPSSITSLAARASSRASVTRALGEVDRPTLTVAEALAVLGTPQMPVSLQQLSAAVGFMADDVAHHLQDLALVFGEPEALWVVDTAREALSAQPLGLGPSLQALGLDAADGWPTTASAVQHVLEEAPDGARRVLDVLAWGPPVGTFEQMPPAVQWLLEARVVHRLSPTQVVLPREIALAL